MASITRLIHESDQYVDSDGNRIPIEVNVEMNDVATTKAADFVVDNYGQDVVTGQDENGNDITRPATFPEMIKRMMMATAKGQIANFDRHAIQKAKREIQLESIENSININEV